MFSLASPLQFGTCVYLVVACGMLTGCHRRAHVVYAVPAASVSVAPPAVVEPQVTVSPQQPDGQWVWTGQKYEWQVRENLPAYPAQSAAVRPAYVIQGPTYVVDRRSTRRAQRAYKRALKRHRRDLRRHRKQMRRYHREMQRQGYSVQGGVYVY